MKRFTGHAEEWGEFLDIRVNLPEVLAREVKRKKKGPVIVSSVTDPYQPAEGHYGITRRCLIVLAGAGWPISILTKSSSILQDIDVLLAFEEIEVGITITSDKESIREIFEPHASPYEQRMRSLEKLREAGISTYAFVGPILPMKDPAEFANDLGRITGRVLLDRMNYMGKVRGLYRRKNLLEHLEAEYFEIIEGIFKRELGDRAEVI
jgi:DNA repair photolyase